MFNAIDNYIYNPIAKTRFLDSRNIKSCNWSKPVTKIAHMIINLCMDKKEKKENYLHIKF